MFIHTHTRVLYIYLSVMFGFNTHTTAQINLNPQRISIIPFHSGIFKRINTMELKYKSSNDKHEKKK